MCSGDGQGRATTAKTDAHESSVAGLEQRRQICSDGEGRRGQSADGHE